MKDNKSNSIVLTFKAVKEKLDWKGEVIEEVTQREYLWDAYDSKVFLDSVIKTGDLSLVPKVGHWKSAVEMFKAIFRDENGKNFT